MHNTLCSDQIEVFCPLDDTYRGGNIVSINSDGHYVVNYEEVVVETLNLRNEPWRACNILSPQQSGFLSVQEYFPQLLRMMLLALAKSRFCFIKLKGSHNMCNSIHMKSTMLSLRSDSRRVPSLMWPWVLIIRQAIQFVNSKCSMMPLCCLKHVE